eukprot:CAMPEP_0180528206 /NCGR_PEP_ID=MMETSP1036_2-20121128/60659_1 /TAXON_ID=632150 /ORGANISM="Azadinium spinosum, Strain 3D9" /LENGTH=235 /DNA_ID=CAMNT_0022541719 /DNA_START=36 /DNA_END=740 /DNA_ORIENTATION=-
MTLTSASKGRLLSTEAPVRMELLGGQRIAIALPRYAAVAAAAPALTEPLVTFLGPPGLSSPLELRLGELLSTSAAPTAPLAGAGELLARRGLRPPPGLSDGDLAETVPPPTPEGWSGTQDTSRLSTPAGELVDSSCSTADSSGSSAPPSPSQAVVPIRLHLEGALSDPLLNQQDVLPSLGSKGHFLGICKPCAFVFKRGCENGSNCEFCHLCPPGTKKFRKREHKAVGASMQAFW